MFLAVLNSEMAAAFGAAAAAFIAQFIFQIMTFLAQRKQAEQVRRDLLASQKETKAGQVVIHGLVNSGNIANKRTIALLARARAEDTKRPADIEFAERMESDLKAQEMLNSAIDPATLSDANFPTPVQKVDQTPPKSIHE